MINSDNIKQRFKAIMSLDNHPGHIATGFAVGVFISFTPVFGLHTAIAVAVAFIFRLNKLTCLTGSWVNTPFTVVPALMASYKLGHFLRGYPTKRLVLRELSWHSIQPYAKSILLGSTIIGFLAAVAAYFICYWLVIAFRRKAKMPKARKEAGETLKSGPDHS